MFTLAYTMMMAVMAVATPSIQLLGRGVRERGGGEPCAGDRADQGLTALGRARPRRGEEEPSPRGVPGRARTLRPSRDGTERERETLVVASSVVASLVNFDRRPLTMQAALAS